MSVLRRCLSPCILTSLLFLAIACGDDVTPAGGGALPPATPTFDPAPGTFAAATNVAINCASADAQVYYTTNGSTPSTGNGYLYTAGTRVAIGSTATLSAVAYRAGLASAVTNGLYDIMGTVAMPTFSVAAGTTNRTFSVTVACLTPGAAIRYTVDNTVPTDTVGTVIVSGASVSITSNLTLRAVASKAGSTTSGLRLAAYVIDVAEPALSVPDGTVLSLYSNVTVTCASAGSTIRYTTNGVDPTPASGYTIASGGSLTVRTNFDLRVIAYYNDVTVSSVTRGAYTMNHTIAGSNAVAGYTGDGGPGWRATVNTPSRVWVDGGYTYFTDTLNHAVRRVGGDGVVQTIAGGNGIGDTGDGGPATAARLDNPVGLCVDGGYVYVADKGNHCIRRFQPGGNIETVAGTCGTSGDYADGVAATSARLYRPYDVAVFRGKVYVADTYNHKIRAFTVGGQITRIAGTGSQGYSGDTDDALDATFRYPQGITVATNPYSGGPTVFVADTDNHAVRHFREGNIIFTTCGGHGAGYGGDGIARTNAAVQLNTPRGVFARSTLTYIRLYIADTQNHAIRAILQFNFSNTDTVSTIMGDGTPGYTGDHGGLAVNARFFAPWGFWTDGSRSCVADTANNAVRRFNNN